jgi:hypothetical protein
MSNPWTIDEDRIPEDERAKTRRRRTQALGLVMWGLLISAITVLLAADTGSLSRVELLSLVALSLGTALVAVGVGALLLILLSRFSILGKILTGLIGMFAFFVLLPAIVSLVLDQLSVFEGLGSGAEQPFVEFIRSLLG